MGDERLSVKCAAMDAIAEIVPTTQHEPTLAELWPFLNPLGDPTLRQSAVRAIAKVSALEDDKAVTMCIERCEDKFAMVRRAALQGLSIVAEKDEKEQGDERA